MAKNQNPGTPPTPNPSGNPSTPGIGQIVKPNYGVGVSSSAPSSMDIPSGYPDNPASLPQVNTGPAAGIPSNVPTIAQGISIMSFCENCGRAFSPDQLGAHMQAENEEGYRDMFTVQDDDDDYQGRLQDLPQPMN